MRLILNMSLASHFKKKSLQRKATLTNLLCINEESGEKSQVSFRAATSKIEKPEAPVVETSTTSNEKNGEETLSFQCPLESSEKSKHQSNSCTEEEQSPFAFDFFDLKDDANGNHKTSKKKKKRKKKKRNGNLSDDFDKVGRQPMLPVEDAESKISRTGQSEHSKKSSRFNVNDSSTPQKNQFGPGELQGIEESNIQTPNLKSEFAKTIRTPPGFSSNTMKIKQGASCIVGNRGGSTLSRQIDKLRETSGERMLEEAPLSAQHQSQSQLETSAIPSQQERKLQFRASDKGRAMVNHGSLAVRKEIHRERTKDSSETSEDNNAFSFGFTFDSLLKDYL